MTVAAVPYGTLPVHDPPACGGCGHPDPPLDLATAIGPVCAECFWGPICLDREPDPRVEGAIRRALSPTGAAA